MKDQPSLKTQRVTMYLRGEFIASVVKIECTKWDVEVGSYAQYDAAVQATFVPKGKRNARQQTKGFQPFCLVLDGWSHADPDGGFTPVKTEGPVQTQQSKYLANSPAYAADFNTMIDAYIAAVGATVLADHRWNSVKPAAGEAAA